MHPIHSLISTNTVYQTYRNQNLMQLRYFISKLHVFQIWIFITRFFQNINHNNCDLSWECSYNKSLRTVYNNKTWNTYLKTLIKVLFYIIIKLYAFMSRRTDAKFNQVVHKRLNQSRLNRYPISISRIAKILSKDNAKAP